MISGREALWDDRDPQGSEDRLRRAAEEAAGADRLTLRTQVARALGLQERYAEAHRELDGVEAARRRLPGIGKDVALAVQARVSLERGRLHRSAGEPDQAAEHFEDAATLAREAGEPALGVDAVQMLALVEPTPQFAVRLHRQALRLARSTDDPAARRWEPSVLASLGGALVDVGRHDQALDAFAEALELRETADPCGRDTQLARSKVAWTLRLLGRTGDALRIQREVKQRLVAAGVDDPFVDHELALLEKRAP